MGIGSIISPFSLSLSGWHYSSYKPGSRRVFTRAQFLKRPTSLNPELKFCSVVCILHSCALLRVTFCIIITVSHTKGSTVFCELELHVLRQENRA